MILVYKIGIFSVKKFPYWSNGPHIYYRSILNQKIPFIY